MPHKRSKRSVRESEKQKKGHNLAPSDASLGSSYVDDTPKGAARIFNSLKVRQDYHDKKKSQAAAAAAGAADKKGKRRQDPAAAGKNANGLPKIIPGESLGDYNRRLEDHMRPAVTQAMRDANAKRAEEERKLASEKKARREAQKEAKRRKDAGLPKPDKEEAAVVAADEERGVGGREASGKRGRDEEASGSDTEGQTPKRGKTEFDKAPQRHSILDVMTAPPVLPKLKKQKKAAPSSIFAPIGRNPFNAGQQRILEEERERVVARYRELKEKQRFDKERETESLKTKKR
ncbi:hypothetical protein NliqN6_4691 [Naganishia liquefaciens]|uniref:Uncharacterized protein n=1 Tax=Naganishia liquefaciens TaxID=104408 RepID=A0A8H3TWD1_9TREE|nr:hypothetical protein NliqN6_4691 [Naganishia liquefaciens]